MKRLEYLKTTTLIPLRDFLDFIKLNSENSEKIIEHFYSFLRKEALVSIYFYKYKTSEKFSQTINNWVLSFMETHPEVGDSICITFYHSKNNPMEITHQQLLMIHGIHQKCMTINSEYLNDYLNECISEFIKNVNLSNEIERHNVLSNLSVLNSLFFNNLINGITSIEKEKGKKCRLIVHKIYQEIENKEYNIQEEHTHIDITLSLKEYISELKKRIFSIKENLPEFWMHEHLKEIQVLFKTINDLKNILYLSPEEDKEMDEIKSWLKTRQRFV